jgi:uncharacterized protein DUF6916
MPASLTEQEFSRHLNSKFRVKLENGRQIDLELVEVKGYLTKAGEQTGMERFSAFFKGPSEPSLAQSTYSLQHDRMGAFDVFLVPIARDEQGVRYEAVYNYFK